MTRTTEELARLLPSTYNGRPTSPGWYIVETDRGVGVCLLLDNGDTPTVAAYPVEHPDPTGEPRWTERACTSTNAHVIRHAPLGLAEAAPADNSETFEVGQVWVSPTGIVYHVVHIEPSTRTCPVKISMRQGNDGTGRLFVKHGSSRTGWLRMGSSGTGLRG